MHLSKLSNSPIPYQGLHLPSRNKRLVITSLQCVLQAQVVAKRVKQGMGIIKRMAGSHQQNAHFPARLRYLLLVQEERFGEKIEDGWRQRRTGMYRIP